MPYYYLYSIIANIIILIGIYINSKTDNYYNSNRN